MLAPLHLDFVSRRRLAWPGIALLVAAASFTAYTGYRWVTLNEANQQLAARIQQAEQQVRAHQAPARSAQAEREALELLHSQQRLSNRLNYPWPEVLAEIEAAAAPESVVLLSVEHNADLGQTRLKVRTRDVPALLAYAKSLNRGKEAGAWSISEHRPASASEPGRVEGQLLRRPLQAS